MDIEVIKEETWIDKSAWGDGPWSDEPDRVEWRIGPFVGLALRNPHMGDWCGYLGLPPGHPWHGQHYDALSVDVHGGLTFADACMDDDRPQRERVCHVPRAGESDDVWWLGFDCLHFMDLGPAMVARERDLLALPPPPMAYEYRDLDYVKREVLTLALQAAMAE